ncbi:MAG: TerB family tellurite resistance protein [Gammaproteobacteria bacterium]|nr:TerB family tellurite resistance protein [Gammaproteobacteria bacterium]MDH5777966.1 TerB family tellurite resistance protein [Gammaproteobacteria bacterium]
MLRAIQKFFEQNISTDQPDDLEHKLKLATGALLIEMMQQDHQVQYEEKQQIKAVLIQEFSLISSEADSLFELAEAEAKEATDLYQFTSLINQHYTQEQKIKVVEYLWRIAYADQHLDAHEEHILRRIADLIYVSHKDFIQTKHKVQARLN